MTLEVERKFPVPDFREVEERLDRLHADWSEPVEQIDQYFAHPCRDFAQTDEALRIRRTGEECRVTYKGRRQGGPSKTRREIEFVLPDAAQATELLEALGFRPFAKVRKRRRPARVHWHEYEVKIALDIVDRLGQFVELEVQAESETAEQASDAIGNLARSLGLGADERRSYLELLRATPSGGRSSC